MVDVEVYLLEMGQVKTVSTGKGSSPRRVLGLILADETLVIQRSLWFPSVEKLELMIMEAYPGEGQDDEFPRLAFAGLELLVKPPAVNSDGQQLSTVMLKLQSLRNTTLKVICKGCPHIIPNPQLTIRSFNGLGQSGVSCNSVGTLTELDPIQLTRANDPMRAGI